MHIEHGNLLKHYEARLLSLCFGLVPSEAPAQQLDPAVSRRHAEGFCLSPTAIAIHGVFQEMA